MDMDKSPLEKWIDAQKGNPGFEVALRKLVSYACAEWFRRENLVAYAPEEALARVLATDMPEYPLGKWLDSPGKNEGSAFAGGLEGRFSEASGPAWSSLSE